MTEDGKVLVRDPNKLNYNTSASSLLSKGFEDGFELVSIKNNSLPCWIYPKKGIESLAITAEGDYYDNN